MNTFVLSCTLLYGGVSKKNREWALYSIVLGQKSDKGLRSTVSIRSWSKYTPGSVVTGLTKKTSDKGDESFELTLGASAKELKNLNKFDAEYSASDCTTLDVSDV